MDFYIQIQASCWSKLESGSVLLPGETGIKANVASIFWRIGALGVLSHHLDSEGECQCFMLYVRTSSEGDG